RAAFESKPASLLTSRNKWPPRRRPQRSQSNVRWEYRARLRWPGTLSGPTTTLPRSEGWLSIASPERGLCQAAEVLSRRYPSPVSPHPQESLVGQAFLPGLFSQAPASQKGPFRQWLRLECGPHHLREGGFALPEGLQLCFSRSRKCLTARSASARKCEASRRSDRTQPRSELPKG